jgi:hypothetical protein
LETVFAADTHIAEEHLVCEETAVNKGNLLNFRTETRMPTVLSKEGQILKPL